VPISHHGAFALAAANYTYYSGVYKPVSSGVSFAAHRYLDASYSSGIPKFNAYAGGALTATPLYGSGNAGIYTGGEAPIGKDKYLYQATFHHDGGSDALSAGANTLHFADYLMFYPLIDLSDDGEQSLDNTLTLPRFTNGKGVRVMIVSTVAGTINTTAVMNYTNSDGVSKTTTFAVLAGNVSNLISTSDSTTGEGAVSPFISIDGDGIRSIESIQILSAADGFASLVLVKPLFDMNLDFWQVTAEKNLVTMGGRGIKVEPGAYLNFITKIRTTLRGFNIRGQILSTYA
jgi:hypothetical protein